MTAGTLERSTTAERLGSTNLERSKLYQATSKVTEINELTVALTARFESIEGYYLDRLTVLGVLKQTVYYYQR